MAVVGARGGDDADAAPCGRRGQGRRAHANTFLCASASTAWLGWKPGTSARSCDSGGAEVALTESGAERGKTAFECDRSRPAGLDREQIANAGGVSNLGIVPQQLSELVAGTQADIVNGNLAAGSKCAGHEAGQLRNAVRGGQRRSQHRGRSPYCGRSPHSGWAFVRPCQQKQVHGLVHGEKVAASRGIGNSQRQPVRDLMREYLRHAAAGGEHIA